MTIKKIILTATVLVSGLMGNVYGEKEIETVVVDENGVTTEMFLVVGETRDGYLNSYPINPEDTSAEYGYILDNDYEVGDIVSVTYRNDDIHSAHQVVGEKLEKVTEQNEEEIDRITESFINWSQW